MVTRRGRRERMSRLSDDLADARYRTAPALARRGESWFVRKLASATAGARRKRLTRSPGATRTLASAHQIAKLLAELRRPGRLPRRMRSRWNDQTAREVARLVLHHTLEIDVGGEFVSGAAAARTIFRRSARSLTPAKDGVSLQALRYGAELSLRDQHDLALRLYGYNRIPPQPLWRQRLATPSAVASWLALDRGRLQTALTRHWTGKLEPTPGEIWLFWQPRAPNAHDPSASTQYKAYVSVAPEQSPEAFARVVQTLVETGPTPFKIAADAHGFFRPDKLIVYFDSWSRLTAFARALSPRLDGLAAHAVPFTAAIGSASRISWGVDFPARLNLMLGDESESWRMWVSRRLALALCESENESLTKEQCVQFALDCAWLDGVDTRTWAPDDALLTELAGA